jgi:hypothetical protein
MVAMQSGNHPSESQDLTDRRAQSTSDNRTAATRGGRPGGGSQLVPRDGVPGRIGVLRRNRLVAVSVAAAIGAYCWFSADLRPFTIPIGAAVAIPAVVVAVLAWRRPDSRASIAADQKTARRLAAPWAVLFGLLTAFEVAAYLSSPRRDHPTLSSMADALMNTHPGRAAVFALWLLLGWALLLRRASA